MDVPPVIAALEDKVRMKGSRTFIPPAFFGRDGAFIQPPSFEMPLKADDENQEIQKQEHLSGLIDLTQINLQDEKSDSDFTIEPQKVGKNIQ